MKYKAEVLYKRRVIHEGYFTGLSHPNQVIRKLFKSMKVKKDTFLIYIANNQGDSWRYSVDHKSDCKYHIRRMEKANDMFNKNEIDMIFSGNSHIMGN